MLGNFPNNQHSIEIQLMRRFQTELELPSAPLPSLYFAPFSNHLATQLCVQISLPKCRRVTTLSNMDFNLMWNTYTVMYPNLPADLNSTIPLSVCYYTHCTNGCEKLTIHNPQSTKVHLRSTIDNPQYTKYKGPSAIYN